MMKKLLMGLVIAALPVGMGIGFCVVEFVWQPAFGAQGRFFAIFLIGCAFLGLVLAPLLIYTLMSDRKQLARGREALAAGDFEAVFASIQPMLAWLTCNRREAGDEAIAMLEEMYRQCEMETDLGEIARLHREYCEVYAEHKDHQGIVHDDEISDDLDQMSKRCRNLAKQLPPPG